MELLGKVTGQLAAGTTVNVVQAQLGVTVEEARSAIQVVQAVEAMSEDEKAAEAVHWLRGKGYTVMPPPVKAGRAETA